MRSRGYSSEKKDNENFDALILSARKWARLYSLYQSIPNPKTKAEMQEIVEENSYLQNLLLHQPAEDVCWDLLKKRKKLDIPEEREEEYKNTSRFSINPDEDRTESPKPKNRFADMQTPPQRQIEIETIREKPKTVLGKIQESQTKLRNAIANYFCYPNVLISIAKKRLLADEEAVKAGHCFTQALAMIDAQFASLISSLEKIEGKS